MMACAAAAACAIPLAAGAQQHSQQQSASRGQAQQPDLVLITISPAMNERQRSESNFRALDTNSDGEISMSEAGVNTELLNAFRKVDRNSNRSIDRQEFARVHVDDGSPQQSSSQEEQASAASGGTAQDPRDPSGPDLPSRSIEERSRGAYPGGSFPAPEQRTR
jgi:hypothetical protein